MPTKTQPKSLGSAYIPPVKIRARDRELLAELLELDPKKKRTFDKAIERLESLLSIAAKKLHESADVPLPTHIVAALKPVATASKALTELIDPGRIHHSALRELGMEEVSDGRLWLLLNEIHGRAQAAIVRLKRQKSSGAHVKAFGDSLKSVNAALAEEFEAIRPRKARTNLAEYEASKAEFLKFCRKYLPKPPTARKRKSLSL